jgi:hypothetical protein
MQFLAFNVDEAERIGVVLPEGSFSEGAIVADPWLSIPMSVPTCTKSYANCIESASPQKTAR